MPDDPRPGFRQFPHVFAPGRIGTLEVPHRIIMGSMHLNFEQDPPALAAFYAERAAGGAGLIVTGGAAVNREGSGGPTYLVAGEVPFREAAAAALEAVHNAGAKLALQLFHAGRYAFESTYGLQPAAPSAVWSAYSKAMPAAMDEEHVRRTLAAFAAAAAQARELGFDAVEIMGSEGYLVNQFASAATNRRDDSWGGDALRRQAFPLAVLSAVRGAVGTGFPVIFRLSGDDLVDGAGPPEEYVSLAGALASGGADALNIGIGWHESRIPTVQAMVPHGTWLPVAARIRQHLAGAGHTVPVIGSNRINSVAQAEAALADRMVDFVSMARPLLADPRIIAKSAAGRPDLVNTCIACNEACIDRSLGTEPVSCLVNPRAGRERAFPVSFPPRTRSAGTPRAAVAGAGPAGLQAAATLAEAGIHVDLFESAPGIGGQFRLACVVPGKADFAETIRYFSRELPRLGVEIHTGVLAGAEVLSGFSHVIDATGVLPRTVRLPGAEYLPVYDYHEAFAVAAALPRRLAIVGAGGIAVDLAHLLAEHRFRQITLLRRGSRIGEGIGPSTRWAVLQALRSAGVAMLTGVSCKEVTPRGLILAGSGGQDELVPADAVIVAAGQVKNSSLSRELAAAGIAHTSVGGAASAAGLNAVRAFAEGLASGRALAGELTGERKRAPLP
ncbi:FAD-dependent oxidoreductase [Arthrobacter sp. zg-Y916]|uniref:oxidoreductase n=1 Tax=Arthrobacter sp. zg-Y916 TaxID=2894190 RepID=UPI001E428FA9|nr:FAD-dependent oxidoreductase [Arthrobacter sp. zg-Y916]MCC9192629.1 FAD-dependent oxidoreductase [Arthrobacter sp. zg-Y916]